MLVHIHAARETQHNQGKQEGNSHMTYPSVAEWTSVNHLRSVAGPCRLCGRFLATNHDPVGHPQPLTARPLTVEA